MVVKVLTKNPTMHDASLGKSRGRSIAMMRFGMKRRQDMVSRLEINKTYVRKRDCSMESQYTVIQVTFATIPTTMVKTMAMKI